jgi:hypothetical protein
MHYNNIFVHGSMILNGLRKKTHKMFGLVKTLYLFVTSLPRLFLDKNWTNCDRAKGPNPTTEPTFGPWTFQPNWFHHQ